MLSLSDSSLILENHRQLEKQVAVFMQLTENQQQLNLRTMCDNMEMTEPKRNTRNKYEEIFINLIMYRRMSYL